MTLSSSLKILPDGRHTFSTAFRQVRQIELTSRCNLRCVFCPNPSMGGPDRPKVDMTDDVFDAALAWVRYFVQLGSQSELNLAGIGESTLHPKLLDYAARARAVIGPDRMLFLTTNGIAFIEEHARGLALLGAKVGVSAHRPEKATAAMLLCKKYGILHSVSNDPMQASIDWAGQVDWPVQVRTRKHGCEWFSSGMAFVMADGRVSHCCLDATGIGVVGSVVSDQPDSIRLKPSALCQKCHLGVGAVYGNAPIDFRQDLAGRG